MCSPGKVKNVGLKSTEKNSTGSCQTSITCKQFGISYGDIDGVDRHSIVMLKKINPPLDVALFKQVKARRAGH